MLTMSQINHIRDLRNCGYRICEIQKETGIDHKTINKYLSIDDFSPEPPRKNRKPSILDPYKPLIAEWLEEDKKHWKKQHHTAQRVFDRLVAEEKYTGSYDTVQRYMKNIRRDTKQKANQELIWDPGCGQVDFGEADFYEHGGCIRKKYLTLSFPYSNDSYNQVFGGETAECVCQGLQDIFHYIGGVPHLLVFDNATGVGRRIRDTIYETELFSRFRAHYRFQIKFCNPESGWEKGNVESKVGYNRRNIFVPVPHYDDINVFNKSLLDAHLTKASELHYKKQTEISSLFEEDRKHLLALPSKKFNVCRYEWLKADGYGKVCMEGKHYYSTCPEKAGKKVLICIRAHYIDILTDEGKLMVRHERQYGDKRTDLSDYSTTLAVLSRNSGAWHNSGVRREVPDILRSYLDSQPKPVLRDSLKLLNELAHQYGYDAAVSAMNMAVRHGSININDASVIAARITGYGIDTPAEAGPPLSIYDEAFLAGKSAKGVVSS